MSGAEFVKIKIEMLLEQEPTDQHGKFYLFP